MLKKGSCSFALTKEGEMQFPLGNTSHEFNRKERKYTSVTMEDYALILLKLYIKYRIEIQYPNSIYSA